jgi:hypothetical protein
VIPERRLPGSDHQHKAGFQKIGGEQNARDGRDDQPPACTRVRRSTRAETSR